MKPMGSHVARGAILVLLVATSVRAQDVPDLWDGIDPTNLETVYVLEDGGLETEGRFVAFRPDEIVLITGNAERRIAASRVRRLERRGDPVRDGAVAGAVVGLIWGALVVGISDCPIGRSSCAGSKAAGVVALSGFSALVGAGIDALRQGRTLVYESPRTAVSGLSIPSHPTSPARLGLRYAFSW